MTINTLMAQCYEMEVEYYGYRSDNKQNYRSFKRI
jgi:hypothetical protein